MKKWILWLSLCFCCLTPAIAAAENLSPISCLLTPAQVSAIGAERTGIVREVRVERADWVDSNELLVQLNDGVAQTDLRVASITAEGLRDRVTRSEALEANNLISVDEIDALRIELALAEAEISRAEGEISRAKILSPFNGYVASVNVSVGEMITSDPLIELLDLSSLKAEMVFLDSAYGQLLAGDELEIYVELVDVTVTSTVKSVDAFIDASSNTFTVIADVPNAALAIPAGASCSVAG